MSFINDPDALMRMPKLTFEISLKTAEETGFYKAIAELKKRELTERRTVNYPLYSEWLLENKERILKGE